MAATIALVDDDRNILTSVSMMLEQEGFQVRTYTDGESALQGLPARPADLAVLDIKMPRMDGMELLHRLRQRSAMPVIFLTSQGRGGRRADGPPPRRRRLHHQAVQPAPAAGAHPRPAAAERGGRAEGTGAGRRRHRRAATWCWTRPAHCVWKGNDIQLTVTEFLLLKALALRPGMVKNRDQLMDAAYGENIYVDDRTIDSHVKRVRKKFRAGRRRVRADRDALRHRLPLQGELRAGRAGRGGWRPSGRPARDVRPGKAPPARIPVTMPGRDASPPVCSRIVDITRFPV